MLPHIQSYNYRRVPAGIQAGSEHASGLFFPDSALIAAAAQQHVKKPTDYLRWLLQLISSNS